MQNLKVNDTILKIKKTKTEIKKELEDSIINGRKNENTDMQDKVNGCITNEDAIKVIQDFEQIIQKEERHRMVSLLSRSIFQKLREKEKFVSYMVSKLNVSKSTIVFKNALKKLIEDFPRIKDSSLSLHYLKKKIVRKTLANLNK